MVGLIVNLQTKSISPQFHVVFDDWFATIGSDHNNPPDFLSDEWHKMFGESTYQYITEDQEDDKPNEDLIETIKSQINADRIAKSQDKANPPRTLDVEEPVLSNKGKTTESDSVNDSTTPKTNTTTYPGSCSDERVITIKESINKSDAPIF